MAEQTAGLRVRFSKRRDKGVLWGRTGPQLVCLTAAAALLVAAVRAGVWWPGAIGAALAVMGFARLHGRALADALPSAAADALLQAAGQAEYRGGPYRPGAPRPGGPGGWRLPGPLSRLELSGYEVGEHAGRVGVIFDRSDGTATAVLQVAGPNFLLEDEAQADVYASGFGQLLDGLARADSPIVAIQLLSRVRPDVGDDAWRVLVERGGHGGRFARQINEDLLASLQGRGLVHESYVVVRVAPHRSRSLVRQFGGGDDGAAALIFHTISRLATDLAGAGVQVIGWVSPRGLSGLVRSAFDPASDAMLARRGGGRGDISGGDPGLPSGVSAGAAEPIRLQRARSYVAHNDHYSRTWWVSELPRSDGGVPVGFLAPLLLSLPARHTVSIVLQPVSPRAAQQVIDQQTSTKVAQQQMDAKIRRRRRRSDERESADIDRRESELVDGFASYRLAVLVSVTAGSLDELEVTSAQAESSLNAACMEGQVWYTETDQAFFMAALPLARGLR